MVLIAETIERVIQIIFKGNRTTGKIFLNLYSGYLKIFIISFKKIDYDVLGCSFFMFLMLGICWTSRIYKFIIFLKFGKILAFFFSKNFVYPPLSLFPFMNLNYTYIRLLEVAFQHAYTLLIFFQQFFLFVFHFG